MNKLSNDQIDSGYKLSICPICHPDEFKEKITKNGMIVTSGLYNYLRTKAKMGIEHIGIFICLSRFDPVVYPNYDWQKHHWEFLMNKPELPDL